ncbi:hypothetical protein AB0G02_16570 [Actinosynnema sp. NPDC023658]|uniref:hypothetical protein n=1 Tax=Actinosynnema sp. NPDC023658 TaxID=3155465 RepID=UPI0033D973DE
MNIEREQSAAGWVPGACTLPTAQRPLRVAEFDDLFATAVTGVRRRDRTTLLLELERTPETAARAADLMVRENGCCSFFAFSLTVADDGLELTVAVPAAHVDVLDALAIRVPAA